MNTTPRMFGRRIEINISRWNDKNHMRREWHKNGVWVTKGGEKIPAEKMSTMHLLNVLHLYEEKAKMLSTTGWALPAPHGEMAQDAYYAGLDHEDLHGLPTKQQVLNSFSFYPFLVKELKKRGL